MLLREYRQCTRCVMDTSDPEITFDEQGQCNHCTEYYERLSKLTYEGGRTDKELPRLIERIRKAGRRKEYDCVIGMSGGTDSSYVAYMARKLGLRPLAVHLDNGWNREEAINNIRNVCSKLDIDYESVVLDWEEFKDLQLAFLRASIVEVEIPTDVAILGALHRIADQVGVKYIISGGNYATEGILPESWFYDPKDARLLRAIHRRFGKRKLKSFPTFSFRQELYYKLLKGIRLIYLLNHVPYSKKQAMELLEMELNWKYYGGKHYESKFTGFAQTYIQHVKFGIDYRKATYSTQICTGELTRVEALELLKSPPFVPDIINDDITYVCKKLGITAAEFENIMNAQPKTYRDYPNNRRFLKLMYVIYRLLYAKRYRPRAKS